MAYGGSQEAMDKDPVCAECGDDLVAVGWRYCLDCMERGAVLTFVSLFAGIGGIDLGLERAGLECRLQVEIDERASTILRRHWPDVARAGDITEVDGADLIGVDVIAGGFPCQDVSKAGKRAGLAGERSGLFWEFHRITATARPRWVVIENVPGLLSSSGGRDMGTVLGALGDLGYVGAYRVLDSAGFGVPQRRRRLFIVGHLGGLPGTAEVLLDARPRVAAAHPNVTSGSNARPDVGGGATARRVYRKARRAQNVDDFETWVAEDFANCLNLYDVGRARATSLVIERDGVRILTPLEWERAQGFPDDWTARLPDGVRCSLVGNAVSPPVAEWVGRRLLERVEVAA